MVDNKILLAGAAIIVYLLTSGKKGEGEFFGDKKYPPGVRNNNPGNIIKTPTKWTGEIGSSGGFKVFKTKEDGIRAMLTLLRSYYYNHRLRTIRGIIYRWADPDNPNYAAFVAKETGIGADQVIQFNEDYIIPIAMAMTIFENRTSKIPNPLSYFKPSMFKRVWEENFE